MKYREELGRRTVAISVSDSPDMPALGLSDEHLRDAMAELARHLLALGARLAYGGDLRAHGFSEVLFELVARHRRDADPGDDRAGVINYLAWPVHITMSRLDLETVTADVAGSAELVCLGLDGARLAMAERLAMEQQQPTLAQWANGLTSMRRVMRAETQARIVLGGRRTGYKGAMPGVAEESLLSLQSRQPLFLVGGFGGCVRDIAETLQIVSPWAGTESNWEARHVFESFRTPDLHNGLTSEENAVLARTPHVDQAVTLILRGLLSVDGHHPGESGGPIPT